MFFFTPIVPQTAPPDKPVSQLALALAGCGLDRWPLMWYAEAGQKRRCPTLSEHVTFISGGYSDWSIVVRTPVGRELGPRRDLRGGQPEEHPTARLAARELQAALEQMSGASLRRVTAISSRAPRFELRYQEGTGDGFTRTVMDGGGGRVILEGDSPRGLLFAVYDTLAELGCRWLYPGPAGARIPHRPTLRLPVGTVRQEPAFPGRCLILGHHFYLTNLADWAVWAARNRLNTLFLHLFPPPNLGGRPESFWAARLQEVRPTLQERSLVVEYGGHGLADLLPRSLFRHQPDAFRFDGTQRTPDHNFCPSHPETRRLIREHAAAFFQAHPGVDVFHLWPDDIVGGGWCQCPLCADLSPTDQALQATNEIAEVLAEVDPAARLAFLAYHDTVTPPTRVRPNPNVCLLYAPRERCYAHALDDDACALNRDTYAPHAREQIAVFAEDGAPEHRVFEYYTDAVLFKSMLPPLPTVLAADLRFYRAAGVHTLQTLMTADRPWVSMPINLWLFARLAWDGEADPAALVADWCAAAFGEEAVAETTAYIRASEAAWQRLLTLAPDEVRMSDDLHLRRILDHPPGDVLDFMAAPLPTRRAKLALLDQALSLLDQAGAHLEAVAETTTQAAALDRERAAFDLTRAQFSYLRARQRAFVLLGNVSQEVSSSRLIVSPAEVEAALQEAQAALDKVLAWGRQHIPNRRDRAIFTLMHQLWALHLRHARYLLLERRRWLLFRTMLDFALAFLRLRFL